MFLHRRYIGFLHTAAVSLAGLAWSAFLDPKITGASFSCSKKAPTLLLLVVVDLGVPEEGLVTVSPEVVLGPDVLEGVLGLVLEGGAVRDVLPVLGPEPVGVDAGEDDGGDHDVDGELAPGARSVSSVLLDSGPLAVESVVGGALELRAGG